MAEARRRQMAASIQEIVVPILRKHGFSGSLPHFRRIKGNTLHLLSFQFDMNDDAFTVEVAACENKPLETNYGEVIPVDKITAFVIPPEQSIRLVEAEDNIDKGINTWFRFKPRFPLFFSNNIFAGVSAKVVSKLNEAEQFWKRFQLGS